MEPITVVLVFTQLAFTIIAGIYFYQNLKMQQNSKKSLNTESKKELEKLKKLRAIKLTKPLSEKTRPEKFEEIIGQEKGIRALRAALCGPNPQHVIIYGPPGVGKTAAARIVLEEAKKMGASPFNETSKFIEIDATITQFDERSIADPLIGSVHDPIYQGAGAYGVAGVPQPKAGAVTKAHGGILFLDEIGELQTIQMNKLLKVLEDRAVFLSSSYYSSEDSNIPKHIHDIFKNGLPADFRLVGATTRSPEEVPLALRSRCTEIFFRGLNGSELEQIATNACRKAEFDFEEEVPKIVSNYANNGRDAVNIVQTSASLATLEARNIITIEDIENVLDFGRYTKKLDKKVSEGKKVGIVNGLAVFGGGAGSILEIEAITLKTDLAGMGTIKVTGIIEEEELSNHGGKMKRKSTAKASVENVITVLKNETALPVKDFDVHINFPGGMPVDGPSAGVAIFTAVYSSLCKKEISTKIAMTGEVTINGNVAPVGGVASKIEAAIEAGIDKVLIPKENWQKAFANYKIEVIPIETVQQALKEVFGIDILPLTIKNNILGNQAEILTAKGSQDNLN